ncbi:uracil-DNA glycosylase [Campylobacter jejuni]|nr:uracil-DNA glycosylase [Campylobacter jejuni]
MEEITINIDKIKINDDWKEFLRDEFQKKYFLEIKKQYLNAINQNIIIYPPANLIFNAFNLCPLKEIKIIILGQDPYHQPNQAMGLSFSVPKNVKIPPSLNNVFKELQNDLNITPAKSKEILIDNTKHLILKAAHPSPLARTGFLGCKHFSKANEFLKKVDKIPIDWKIV